MTPKTVYVNLIFLGIFMVLLHKTGPLFFPSEIVTTFLLGLFFFRSHKSFRFTIWHLKNNLNNVGAVCYLGLSDTLPDSIGRQMFLFRLAFMFSKPFMLVLK